MNSNIRPALAAAAALGAGTILALAAPLAANAHVGVDPTETAAGAYTVLGFGIPHGCGESPTTKLTFTMPDGIDRVTPTVNSNWSIEKVVQQLDEPKTDSHGANITERVAQVVYTAVTPLPSDLRDVIELSLQLPEDAAGETLAFPVLQECTDGSTDWSEVAENGAAEPEHPAPTVTVTEASGADHGHTPAEVTTEEHAVEPTASAPADDTLARGLGIGGLVVGAVGVVLAVMARRSVAKRS
ncbi:YcnI family protein [Agromyces albus]|uniref:YcnI family copper-binding membrane protein n=1 Tax=Agromyces albus TaxID=205332 RepID=UPI0013E93FBC|nr:YcnI family protein [Agromyces albus]